MSDLVDKDRFDHGGSFGWGTSEKYIVQSAIGDAIAQIILISNK